MSSVIQAIKEYYSEDSYNQSAVEESIDELLYSIFDESI